MEFLPCFRGREAPCHRGLGGIARVFIRRDLTTQRRFVRYPTVETLALQEAQFDFGHI